MPRCEVEFAIQQAPILHQQGYTIPALYQEIYSGVSCNDMGGELELFQINIPAKEVLFHRLPLVEHGIEYIEDVFLTAPLINLSNASNINWGNNTPNKQRYAANTAGPWHDTMQSGDVYCCDWNYTTNVWGAPYKKVGSDGKNGQNGVDGSDANVNYTNVKSALNRAANAAMTIIDGAAVDTVDIYANNIYGGNIYGGKGDLSFAQVDGSGLSVFREGIAQSKVFIGTNNAGEVPQIKLGAGDGAGANIFDIFKQTDEAYILYSQGNGVKSGFRFSNGIITPVGELSVTAKFK